MSFKYNAMTHQKMPFQLILALKMTAGRPELVLKEAFIAHLEKELPSVASL